MPDPQHTLAQIQQRLADGIAPTQVIEEFLPRSRAEALAYARRLPLWDEYRGQFPPQVVALARVLSRRGMLQFALMLDRDGHVVEEPRQRSVKPPGVPRRRFSLRVRDEEVQVEYAPHYLPNSDEDLFTFISPHEPPRPHPLSETGCWSHFTSRDAVEACGGPESYAALLAEAALQGEREFDAVFHGARPETLHKRRKPAAPPSAVPQDEPSAPQDATTRQAVGPHSARLRPGETGPAAPPPAEQKPEPGFLF